MALTREQLRAIHAAKKTGLSKRELFESEIALKKLNRLSPREKAFLLENQDRINLFRVLGVEQSIDRRGVSRAKRDLLLEKGMAASELRNDIAAKEAFIKENSLNRDNMEEMK